VRYSDSHPHRVSKQAGCERDAAPSTTAATLNPHKGEEGEEDDEDQADQLPPR
jgi:hypothetical protein